MYVHLNLISKVIRMRELDFHSCKIFLCFDWWRFFTLIWTCPLKWQFVFQSHSLCIIFELSSCLLWRDLEGTTLCRIVVFGLCDIPIYWMNGFTSNLYVAKWHDFVVEVLSGTSYMAREITQAYKILLAVPVWGYLDRS